MQEQLFRTATASDVEEMRSLLVEHGSNDWNYLPQEDVTKELADVAEGKAVGLIVEIDKHLVGFAILYPGLVRFPQYTDPGIPEENVAYTGNVVVHSEHAGKGLGTNLMEQAKMILLKHGASRIYVDCHEENAASRGMLRNACFEEVALYFDSERRFVGSCKTWVGLFSSANSVKQDKHR